MKHPIDSPKKPLSRTSSFAQAQVLLDTLTEEGVDTPVLKNQLQKLLGVDDFWLKHDCNA